MRTNKDSMGCVIEKQKTLGKTGDHMGSIAHAAAVTSAVNVIY